MIADDPEFLVVEHGRLVGVRRVGEFFGFLAVVAGLAGLYWIVNSFRNVIQMNAGSDGWPLTFARLFAPVAIAAAGTWCLLGIGLGLRRGSAIARWSAVGLLLPACIPPLVRFFEAVWGGDPMAAAPALVLLVPPGGAAALLADDRTDLLFRPKAGSVAGAMVVGPAKGGSRLIKIAVLVLGLLATIVLLAMEISLVIAAPAA